MNILFVTYPWDRIEASTDTTLRLIYECALRKHRVGILVASNLTIRDCVTSGFCKMLVLPQKISSNLVRFHQKMEFKEQLLPLSGFDAIFIRSNPPIDITMLNFLDSVRDDTFIINDVDGLRKANNKLYTATFDDSIIPVTHVSKNKAYLRRVLAESQDEKMILKPFNGYGGSGVIVLEKSAQSSVNSLLDFYIDGKNEENYVILQEYLHGASEGDVRILMLNGEPIGAMKRVPAQDDVRSNIHAGGEAKKHVLTKKELALCKKIGPRLVADGLYFVGIDVIDDKVLEVNVLSPGGIARINKLNRVKLEKKVIDFVEEVVTARNRIHLRKSEFKKSVENA
ncbi:MAG: glutathione synthase [SAR324 cluster bacterium]|nr:glutathione synthase [SAR324 cluster bacterium]